MSECHIPCKKTDDYWRSGPTWAWNKVTRKKNGSLLLLCNVLYFSGCSFLIHLA